MNIPIEIISLLSLDVECAPLKELNDAQKKYLRDNFNCISTYGLLISDECILFTHKSAFDNWCHYAGFEYIYDKDFDLIQINGKFFACFDSRSDRAYEIIEALGELSEEKDLT